MIRRLMSSPSNFIKDVQGSFWCKHFFKAILWLTGVVLFCEVIIYYVVLLRCTWPLLDSTKENTGIFLNRQTESPLKVMMVADTHLLGPFRGHWFDRLRREWQMSRTFVAAMTLHQPDVVVFLGDIFDEGQWMDNVQFNKDVQRFKKLFPKPEKTKFIVAPGNHDIGFHYKMTKPLLARFLKIFTESSSGVEMKTIKGTTFIALNSMALEGDGCRLCEQAEKDLREIEQTLNCSLQVHEKKAVDRICEKLLINMPHYNRPVILQHFPLYRTDDKKCLETDQLTASAVETFRERWEVLSKEMTYRLLKLNPRAIFDGHSHHSCLTTHLREGSDKVFSSIPEWTLPSFNWRNKNNPSFVLSVFTPNNFAVSRCSMPKESTVITIYIISSILLVLWLSIRRYRWNRYQGFVKLPMQRS